VGNYTKCPAITVPIVPTGLRFFNFTVFYHCFDAFRQLSVFSEQSDNLHVLGHLSQNDTGSWAISLRIRAAQMHNALKRFP
jgi:hypothetical protein